MKPCIVISTVFNDRLKETAVAFVEALNGDAALREIYNSDTHTKKSGFIPIKKHRTLDAAAKYHVGLAKKMQNGCSQKIWNDGYKPYAAIYHKHCPPEMKQK